MEFDGIHFPACVSGKNINLDNKLRTVRDEDFIFTCILNDLVTVTFTCILKIAILTLLPPGIFVFYKNILLFQCIFNIE